MFSKGSRPGRAGLAAVPVDGIVEADPHAWNRICAAGQGPVRHDYVCAWENARLPGLVSRPLLAHDEEGSLVAAAPAYFYELDMGGVQSNLVASLLQKVRWVMPRLLVSHVFEIGSPTPLVPPFLRDPEAPPHAAVATVVEAGLEEAEAGGAEMVIVQSFARAESGSAETDVLTETGFSQVPIPQTVVVDLPFGDFDEYLGAMRSQYRRRARKTLEASSHLHVEHVADFGGEAHELARLWRLVYERADELKREILGVPYFRAVAELDYVSVLALRRDDGSLASYALLLDDRPRLHFLYTGFPERVGREEAAYFRLLYEIVRFGIEQGYTSVNLGLTTLEPKLDVGGVPVPLYGWIRHRNPLLQRAFTRLAQGPFAPDPVEPRRVFKD